jgi:tetratricopeptide (TPR) repeat protein
MPNEPVSYKGVMVSSTFTDLVGHRRALIKAINGQQLKPNVMENDSAKPGVDVLDSSLQMVRDASAYVGVISHKYGQIPDDPVRNPSGLSLTELEFNEAVASRRPILLFLMGDGHRVKRGDVEIDPGKIAKLNAFRERAKRMGPDSAVPRVYKVFENLSEFKDAAAQSVAELRRYLDASPAPEPEDDLIPAPPVLYAEPPYIGSHTFVGREAQLATLSDWAASADPHPVLLFEAIGGTGKSMLTWEWTTNHAAIVRPDWAGRFWYSFYEKGSVMADFCRRALAYMTGRPLRDFRGKRTVELSDLLLRKLRARPWLLVLDGLERVLVAYHRIDAAQLADEEAGGSDAIVRRDPCAAIRPEDDDLLRALASAAPSKVLITSRLIPRVLLNQSSQAIPGVRHEHLPGLRPADAEALLRSCGVTGTSAAMQSFLQSHCDCHPLVTGALAGLIHDYLPGRGNFDRWAEDPNGGPSLNLSALDLVQKRNHILRAAIGALPEKGRQLLSTFALLSEAIDFNTLSALNPHLPPEPEKVEEPEHSESSSRWKRLSDDEKEAWRQRYEEQLERRREYESAVEERRQSVAFRDAPQELENTVRDLERRGLLQYDRQSGRYDLHPVVRGVTAGGLGQKEREGYGQLVVDYFSRQSHNPYENAETLEDIGHGLHLVRTFLQMGRHQQAVDAYRGDLANALVFNLEAYATTLALLRPFFRNGWVTLPDSVDQSSASYLANYAGLALDGLDEPREALAAYGAGLYADLGDGDWRSVTVGLSNISYTLRSQNRIAAEGRCRQLELKVAGLTNDNEKVFVARLHYFHWLSLVGRKADAEQIWSLLDPMGRDWSRPVYRLGMAEALLARFRFTQGTLQEADLLRAETLAKEGQDRRVIRDLHQLRGEWHLEHEEWSPAATSLHEAVRMAREIGQTDPEAEAQLALANLYLGHLGEPRQEAERLSQERDPSHHDLAVLWLAVGDAKQAKTHALAAYTWAWADGEPYVRRYRLDKARGLLEQLGAELPSLPSYDPDKDETLPWEQELADAVAKARTEREGGGGER